MRANTISKYMRRLYLFIICILTTNIVYSCKNEPLDGPTTTRSNTIYIVENGALIEKKDFSIFLSYLGETVKYTFFVEDEYKQRRISFLKKEDTDWLNCSVEGLECMPDMYTRQSFTLSDSSGNTKQIEGVVFTVSISATNNDSQESRNSYCYLTVIEYISQNIARIVISQEGKK